MASGRRRVVWAFEAQEAPIEALEFIAEDLPDDARRARHPALDLAASLETLGERGRTVPDYDAPSIRETFVYSYQPICWVDTDTDTVTIIAFLHEARDFERRVRRRR